MSDGQMVSLKNSMRFKEVKLSNVSPKKDRVREQSKHKFVWQNLDFSYPSSSYPSYLCDPREAGTTGLNHLMHHY